jgi:hypothetical protein
LSVEEIKDAMRHQRGNQPLEIESEAKRCDQDKPCDDSGFRGQYVT